MIKKYDFNTIYSAIDSRYIAAKTKEEAISKYRKVFKCEYPDADLWEPSIMIDGDYIITEPEKFKLSHRIKRCMKAGLIVTLSSVPGGEGLLTEVFVELGTKLGTKDSLDYSIYHYSHLTDKLIHIESGTDKAREKIKDIIEGGY